ncbi:hypothetical protein DFH07DRAFT_766258 [Mycena maculata]|uniref:Uncharacterized protein n=1 Tax=Mycena maculata TaxID=230809 RepID=A0AAD7K6B8_9AGAR|nr:hypothetical protein DFH07DRAFT_766258 [Mycena maculata]
MGPINCILHYYTALTAPTIPELFASGLPPRDRSGLMLFALSHTHVLSLFLLRRIRSSPGMSCVTRHRHICRVTVCICVRSFIEFLCMQASPDVDRGIYMLVALLDGGKLGLGATYFFYVKVQEICGNRVVMRW